MNPPHPDPGRHHHHQVHLHLDPRRHHHHVNVHIHLCHHHTLKSLPFGTADFCVSADASKLASHTRRTEPHGSSVAIRGQHTPGARQHVAEDGGTSKRRREQGKEEERRKGAGTMTCGRLGGTRLGVREPTPGSGGDMMVVAAGVGEKYVLNAQLFLLLLAVLVSHLAYQCQPIVHIIMTL